MAVGDGYSEPVSEILPCKYQYSEIVPVLFHLMDWKIIGHLLCLTGFYAYLPHLK